MNCKSARGLFPTLLCLLAAIAVAFAILPASALATGALTLPPDAGVMAKIVTPIDLSQCKPGDVVEAQTTEDVKSGKDVLLKKGSIIVGHVTLVEPPTAEKKEQMIGIVFDTVKPKNGADETSLLVIRALAPEVSEDSKSTIAEGRGMPGATDHATVAGHVDAGTAAGGRLNASSVGVSGIPNLRIGSRTDAKGNVTSILAISVSGVKLKKGTQIVFKAPTK